MLHADVSDELCSCSACGMAAGTPSHPTVVNVIGHAEQGGALPDSQRAGSVRVQRGRHHERARPAAGTTPALVVTGLHGQRASFRRCLAHTCRVTLACCLAKYPLRAIAFLCVSMFHHSFSESVAPWRRRCRRGQAVRCGASMTDPARRRLRVPRPPARAPAPPTPTAAMAILRLRHLRPRPVGAAALV